MKGYYTCVHCQDAFKEEDFLFNHLRHTHNLSYEEAWKQTEAQRDKLEKLRAEELKELATAKKDTHDKEEEKKEKRRRKREIRKIQQEDREQSLEQRFPTEGE